MNSFPIHPPGPVLFGSSEALDRWLSSVISDPEEADTSLPIDLDEDDSWWETGPVSFDTPSTSSESPAHAPLTLIDTRPSGQDRRRCFCCYRCTECVGLPSERSTPPNHLTMLWARIQYQAPKEMVPTEPKAAHPLTIEEPSPTECGDSSQSTSPSDSPALPVTLSLDPPVNQKPTTQCADCGSSLFSAKSLMSPPGYCEYSGRLVCGGCFESRQFILPWRLARALPGVRGNVSKLSAGEIQRHFYSTDIQFESIEDRLTGSGGSIISTVHRLRGKLLTFREMILGCPALSLTVQPILQKLPAHIRTETRPSDAELYSLADLVDILTPASGQSVIATSLHRAVAAVETHACPKCEARFTRHCSVCDRSVKTLDPTQWQACHACDSSFHRKCVERSLDGCPVCASLYSPRRHRDMHTCDDVTLEVEAILA